MKKLLILLLVLGIVFSTGLVSVAANHTTDESSEEYLVMFDGPAEKGLLQAFGVKTEDILYEYSLKPVVHLELTSKQARGLQNHPQIKYVEKNAEAQAFGQTVPWGVPHVQSTEVHNMGQTGTGVKVAILDTGIDNTHEDLAANVKGGHSVFTDTANKDPFYDGSGHGTHVAGTVGAIDNNLGVIGVAYQSDLYAVKVLNNDGSGSYAGIAEGIEWSILNGMDIINMSLGGSQSSSILKEFCDLAYDEGLLVVAAAGNSGNRGGNNDSVGYPAKYESVIAVAAIDENNNRASFSSTGPAVEISAPGVSVLSTIPGNGYASYNGTSMASPHVAGVAALVWGEHAHLTNKELRNLLNNTAIDLGRSNQFGNGLVQAKDAIDFVR
ncbi:S8 family peptidase [Alkalihalobacterium sp. APHAB7]|uniref:S8 family peptidase n=1 Tax=Alkalihalobacterium sp. APHAB7 TaxID=3402081 RepID=UPI003AAA9BB3